MRILIVTPALNREGGIASYFGTIRPYFKSSVDYFTIGSRTHGEKLLTHVLRFVLDYWRFVKALWMTRYDAVHLNPPLKFRPTIREGLLLLIAKMFQKRVVVFFHGWDLDFEKTVRRCWLWLFRRVYFQADVFIVLAEEVREKLIDMGCKKPIYLETTAVDDALLQRVEAEEEGKCVEKKAFHLLFLSRVEKTKGIYETLDAYALVKKKHPEVTLTVAGNGGELAGAQAYAADHKLSDVAFSGFLRGEQKHEVFSRANCYVLPTYGEGMPNSVLEAMTYGLPVVTRSVGGLADFFVHGNMGFITTSKEPQGFADYIEHLVEKPELCKKIGKYNQAYVGEHFMMSETAKRIENIYVELEKAWNSPA